MHPIDIQLPPLPGFGERLWTDAADYRNSETYKKASKKFKHYADCFHENGYVVVENSVSNNIVDKALDKYDKWKIYNQDQFDENRKKDGNPPRLVDYHSEDSDVQRLFSENKALYVQDFLFGFETSIYTSLFFEVSTQQPFHRDAPVFRTSPENFYFGMWVALEDAEERNGALWVIPGGHLLHVDPYGIGAKFFDDAFDIPEQDDAMWVAYQNAVQDKCSSEGLEAQMCELKRGSTLIWHPLLPHSGGPILEQGATRHSIVFHTVPFGMAVYRQNVFFNPAAAQVTPYSRFDYETMPGGRKFAKFGGIKLRNR